MVRVKGFSITTEGTKWLTLAAVSLIALAGIILILYSTAIAPWAFSDSAAYITTAQNIAEGRGVVIQDSDNSYSLLTHHAPLYPIMLSVPIALGIDVLHAIRWMNAVIYGLTILLAGWATNRFTRSFWLSFGVALLCAFSYEPLLAFTSAMSEGLFIFFSMLVLVLVSLAILESERQNRYLIFAGIAAGLAFLTRYIGLSLLAAGVLSIMVLVKGDIKTRTRKTVYFLIPGIILASIWLVPVYYSTHTFGGWPIGGATSVSAALQSYFTAFMDGIGSWLPFFYRGNHIITPAQKLVVAGIVLVVLIAWAVKSLYKKGEPFGNNEILTWIYVLSLFCICYIGVHLTSYVINVEKPAINGRLLLPIFYAGVLLATALVAFISHSFTRRWLGGLIFTALALLTLWYFHAKVQYFVFEMHHYGQGYTSNRWNENLIFDRISSLDDDYTLYSNEPALVLFYNRRFPKKMIINEEQTGYEWPHTGKEAIILFIGAARKDIGESYPGFVESVRSEYQTFYEDNEGMIFIPTQP